jgi:hypothetical protein
MIDELTITAPPEVGAIANHPTTRLCFNWTSERWKFAEYFMLIQSKSETLLSLHDTIEQWRCTPLDELFKEIRNVGGNIY